MSRRGRKPDQEPVLAYDVRRVITLVQVLAMNVSHDVYLDAALIQLCKGWGVEPSLSTTETIRALAQHAIKHYREGGIER